MPRKRNQQKKGKKTAQKVQTVAVVKRQPMSRQSRVNIGNEVERVCAITDPFCPGAIGSKYPDNSSIRTFAYPIHLQRSIGMTVGGDACVLVWPEYGWEPIKLATTLTPTVATFTTDFTALAGITQVLSYRNVTYGIRIKNTTAPLSSGGMMRIRGYGIATGASFLAIDRASYNCDYYADIPLQDVKDVVVVGRKLGIMAQNFRPYNADATVASRVTDWGPIVIDVVGADPSASFAIELFIHQEYILDDINGLQVMATAAPPLNPITKSVADTMSSTASSVFAFGLKSFSNSVKTAAMKAIGSYFGPPGAMLSTAMVPMLVD